MDRSEKAILTIIICVIAIYGLLEFQATSMGMSTNAYLMQFIP